MFRAVSIAEAVAAALIGGMKVQAQSGKPQPKVSALSLFHVRIPPRLAVDTLAVQARFDSLLLIALGRTRCRVVPSLTADSILSWVTDSAGGYYDPNTGEINSKRYRLVMQIALRKLAHDLGVRNTIFPRVDEVSAALNGGVVKWDGTNQFYRDNANGSARATSLTVDVLDSLGETKYTASGGIELLERGSPLFHKTKTYSPDELFRDVDRLAGAVNLALGPMYSRLAAWCNPT
jgi:hypothetical protein